MFQKHNPLKLARGICVLRMSVCSLALSTISHAALVIGDVINIDLQRSENGVAATTGNEGPYSQAGTPTWNVLNSNTGSVTNSALLDAGGQNDGITFTASGTGSWRSSDYPNTAPNRVTYDYWFDNADALTFSLNNLSIGRYELYVVAGISTFTEGVSTTVRVQGVDKVIAWPNDGASGNTSLPLPWTAGANYVKYEIELLAPGSISGSILKPAGAGHDAILNGLQLVVVPEPSSALLGSLGMLALLRRRR